MVMWLWKSFRPVRASSSWPTVIFPTAGGPHSTRKRFVTIDEPAFGDYTWELQEGPHRVCTGLRVTLAVGFSQQSGFRRCWMIREARGQRRRKRRPERVGLA